MSTQLHECPACGARISTYFALCKPCVTLLESNRLRHVAQHAQDYHNHSHSSLSNQKFLKKERYKREAVAHLNAIRAAAASTQEATHGK